MVRIRSRVRIKGVGHRVDIRITGLASFRLCIGERSRNGVRSEIKNHQVGARM